jgi:hypothetical protein
VDSLAENWSFENGVPCELIKPDWKTYRRSAGLKRNIIMVDKCGAVRAIWDGESQGTNSRSTTERNQGKRYLCSANGRRETDG